MFKWLDFKITNRCNNHCVYCGEIQDPPESANILTAEDIAQTLQDALDIGFTHFALLGGEPSLRTDFDQILKPLQEGRKFETIMVITNLLEFNEQMYREVFKTKAATAQIVTSIDNLKAPNYKNQNPKKTLEYTAQIREIAKEYAPLGQRDIHVHSVISRENLHNIESHVSYFSNQEIDLSLALVEPFEIVTNVTQTSLRYNQFVPQEMADILEQLDQLEKNNKLNWANRVLRKYLQEYMRGDLQNYTGCTAGKNHVIIEADGLVYPCLTESYRRGLNYGNIQKLSFTKIYHSMQSFQCKSEFQQTCWDHYLWTELDRLTHQNQQDSSQSIQSNNRNGNSKNNNNNERFNIDKTDRIDLDHLNNPIYNPEIINPLPKPRKLVLELSAHCNLNCTMCGFNPRAGFQGGFISSELVKEILSQQNIETFFTDLQEIRLNGRGESTLHPEFPHIIRKIRSLFPTTRLSLYTNLMFPEDNLLNVFQENQIELYISIDGGSKESYEAIRRGADFGTLIRRLEMLQQYPNKFAVFTLQTQNISQITEMSKLAKRYDMGLIYNVFRSDNPQILTAFSQEITSWWEEIIQAFHNARAQGITQQLLIPDQIAGKQIPEAISTTLSSASLTSCPNAHFELMISYSGEVFPCNMFNPSVLGTIQTNSLLEIWNSFARRQFIKTHKMHPYCQNCEFMILKEEL